MGLRTADFDYALPQEAIAQVPAPRRDLCRLAVVDRARGSVEHTRFSRLGAHLAAGDLLVLNDSRVLPARIPCRRPSGGAVEVFLLDPLARGPLPAFLRPAGRVRFGEALAPELAPGAGRFILESRRPDGIFELSFRGDGPLDEARLRAMGLPPLPPYIHRDRLPAARQRSRDARLYQNVYARIPGSVAAPTAGLHFTAGLLKALQRRGIAHTHVTLHVGAGTFSPVKTEDLLAHPMHEEVCRVPPEAARAMDACAARGGRVVAVGTTVLRTLESCVRADGGWRDGWVRTRLFITPGHRFRTARGLLTNFHQPRSTLLPLVAAFWEREGLLRLYAECLARGYRFLSYGDACLFL